MKREDVLMEALPYIQKFYGKTIVIKLGGHAMVDQKILETVIRDAVLLHYVGMKVVLVHGGGPEITAKIAAKKHLRIYEVPISYYGRTYAEGKKINWKDGCRAIWCILKYNIFR